MHSRNPHDQYGRGGRFQHDDDRHASHERGRALDDESGDPVGRDPYAQRRGQQDADGDRGARGGYGPAQRQRHRQMPGDASGSEQQGYAGGQYGHGSQFGYDTDDSYRGGAASWGGRESGGRGAYGGSSGGDAGRHGQNDAYFGGGYGNERSRDYGNEGYGYGASYGEAQPWARHYPRGSHDESSRGQRQGGGYDRDYGSSQGGYGRGEPRQRDAFRGGDYQNDSSRARSGYDGNDGGYMGGQGAGGSRGGTSHRGVGPRGYTRSDTRLQEDINERLTDDPSIDASDIDVQVKDGKVTLTGQVDSRWTKHRVEDLVDACSGVKDIENRLSVAGRGGRTPGQQSGSSGVSGSGGTSSSGGKSLTGSESVNTGSTIGNVPQSGGAAIGSTGADAGGANRKN